jgi:signal transduction histidine kinase
MEKATNDPLAVNEWLESKLQQQEARLVRMERELQFEAALERIRARVLSMQKSEELLAVVSALRHEFGSLNVPGLTAATICLEQDNGRTRLWDITFVENLVDGPNSSWDFTFRVEDSDPLLYIRRIWESEDDYFIVEQDEQDFVVFVTWLKQFRKEDAEKIEQVIRTNQLKRTWHPAVRLEKGRLSLDLLERPSAEIKHLLQKTGAAFDLAYRRFLDLQKAESQARQAQIEASLERVRSRVMAMQRSDELSSLIAAVYTELNKLDVGFDRCFIMLFDPDGGAIWWMASPEAPELQRGFKLPFHEHKPHLAYLRGWNERQEKWEYVAEGEDKRVWDDYIFSETELSTLPEAVKAFMKSVPRAFLSASFNTFGCLTTGSMEPLADEAFDILIRFAKVFDLTYTRFNDLKQAEAQAREAQIEAALEKVRSRSLAMHQSRELEQVAGSLFDQLAELGLSFDGALVFAFDKKKRNISLWIATNQLSAPVTIDLPYDKTVENNAILRDLWNAIENGEHIINRSYSGEVKNEYFRYVAKYNESKTPESIRQLHLEKECWTGNFAAEKNSMIGFDSWSGHPTTEEDFKILIRFSKVFEQAYTRFLDLQKAEAQAREAKIELALERVRARAMAMQKSSELADAAQLLYHEFGKLGINTFTCGYQFIDEEKNSQKAWAVLPDGTLLPDFIEFPLAGDPVLDSRYKAWRDKKPLYICKIQGEENKAHHQFLSQYVPPFVVTDFFSRIPDLIIFYCANFSSGYLFIIASEPLPEENELTIVRFAKVFEMTFTRFLDLQKAEASTRQAVRQAALDRVRAEIASMRTQEDLQRVTPLIWNELTTLGIPFIRCGIFIIQEKETMVEVYLSTPEGQSLAVLHLPFDASDLTIQTVDSWRTGEGYHQHWDQEDFLGWSRSLLEQGQIKSPEAYQGAAAPPESLELHFIPFTQGMLYVGSAQRLSDEEIDLVKALADAFAIAYARYEDFDKLDKAKQSIEATLTELKATQAQLIQKEKLASLGELTAGIAHEIQNPLNFINNFSEVNVELMEELRDALQRTNLPEAQVIISDLIGNEQKIGHHGRRADAIVRGMMQHARAMPGDQRLADLNALADEYLRLAYQGVRTKDSTFTCVIETDFDPQLGQVRMVAADMGRVLLNLYTNAFYALKQKQLSIGDTFTPSLYVSIQRRSHCVEIKVKDNGTGMPPEVVDKIFQPFFTTKPSGEGTGLGLSLSHDIITKGHGGELRVESVENIGTTFSILLTVT